MDPYRFLEPGLISSTIVQMKLDLFSANHKGYINLLLAQFPVIVNTYLELKLLKIPFQKFSATITKSLGK